MLALQFIVFMAVILIVSIGLIVYRVEQARRRRREFESFYLARVRVPAEQLDPARLRVLRAVRDDVPDDLRGARRLARLGRHRVLQQVDDAARARPAVPRRRGAAARLAQDHARAALRSSSCSRSALMAVDDRRLAGRVFPQITHDDGDLRGHDRAADLARQLRPRARSCSARSRRSSAAARSCAARQTGSDPFTSLIGLVLVEAPQVRRLHRPPRRRGHVRRLRRQGVRPDGRSHDRQAGDRATRRQSRRADGAPTTLPHELAEPRSRSATTRSSTSDLIHTSDDHKDAVTAQVCDLARRREHRHRLPGEVGLPQGRRQATTEVAIKVRADRGRLRRAHRLRPRQQARRTSASSSTR